MDAPLFQQPHSQPHELNENNSISAPLEIKRTKIGFRIKSFTPKLFEDVLSIYAKVTEIQPLLTEDSIVAIENALVRIKQCGVCEWRYGSSLGLDSKLFLRQVGCEPGENALLNFDFDPNQGTDTHEGAAISNAFRERIDTLLRENGIDVPIDSADSEWFSSLKPPRQQRIIDCSAKPEELKDVLGEKALKLLQLSQVGFQVPPFFIILGSGHGELEVDESLKSAFNSLEPPLIARSAHREEGRIHSYAGVFESIGGITQLIQNQPDFSAVSEEDRSSALDDNYQFDASGLTEAYRRVIDSGCGFHCMRYLRTHQITDFDPLAMDLIVMQEVKLSLFAMFLTRDCHDPALIHIHYEIRGEEADKLDHFDQKGGVVTYNRESDTLVGRTLHTQYVGLLEQFGRIAARIDDLFGMQQIEIGSDGNEVYVLQSRTISLSDPNLIPRISVANPLPGEFVALGYAFLTLPIIVIDSIDNTRYSWKQDPAYRKLQEEGSIDGSAGLAISAFEEQRRQAYREELLALKRQFSEYALVVKDAKDVVLDADSHFETGRYDFLNILSSSAKVVVAGRNQTAIRHGDWDFVECGGLKIIPAEDRQSMSSFFFDGETFIGPIYSRLTSGDTVNFLSNHDGVFIWPQEDGQ